jgi:hypothetical protein
MMKKMLIWIVVLLAGCSLIPTPDDFPPPPPMTPIVEFPQVTATTTIEPRMRPIVSNDMQDAETFFLIVKTSMAAGDNTGVAERVKYPIRVRVSGQELVLKNKNEFLDQYEKIFDQGFVTALSDIDESNLSLLPNGVQVGNGELWFNYFCVDLACSDAHFLITQINK